MKDERDMIVYENRKDIYNTYFIKEREYLMSKYKDTYLWTLYLYYLENKNLHIFYKSNNTILKELYNCMSLPKLIECKKILIEENILDEILDENGKRKEYVFRRLNVLEEQLNTNSESDSDEPLNDVYTTTKRRLVVPLKNTKLPDSCKSLDNQQIKPDFEAPNINNINNNKLRESNTSIYTDEYKEKITLSQKKYIDELQLNSSVYTNTPNIDEIQSSHAILLKIKDFFKIHAEHRMQDLTRLEMPNTVMITASELAKINKKLSDTKNNFDDFLKWLANDDIKKYIINSRAYKIISSIDSQANIYIEHMKTQRADEKKKNSKPVKLLTDEELDEILRS